MKTLEQVKEHLSTTYYDCSDKICGFIVGCKLKDPKEVIKFLKEDDYVYNFDDFLEWFDDEEDEEEDDCDCHCCKRAKGNIPELHKHFYNTVESLFHDVLLGKDIVFQVKEEPKEKPFKYQGEEREKLNKDYIATERAVNFFDGICSRENGYIDVGIYSGLVEKLHAIRNKLQERVDE